MCVSIRTLLEKRWMNKSNHLSVKHSAYLISMQGLGYQAKGAKRVDSMADCACRHYVNCISGNLTYEN